MSALNQLKQPPEYRQPLPLDQRPTDNGGKQQIDGCPPAILSGQPDY
jgi:hypothetical protein